MNINLISYYLLFLITAGRTTTNEELEEMLEQGNSAVFTQGVSFVISILLLDAYFSVYFCVIHFGK